MTDVFSILRRNTSLLFGGLASITLLFVLLSFLFYNSIPATRYDFSGDFWGDFYNAHELLTSFSRDRGLLYMLLVGGGLYGFMRLAFEVFWRAAAIELLPANWRSEAFLYLVCLAIAFFMAFSGAIACLFVFLALPFTLTFAYSGYAGLASIKETFRFVYTNLVKSYDSFFLLLLMAIPMMWLVDTTIGGLLFAFLDWVFYADVVTIDNANVVLQSILYFFLFGLLFVIWGVSFALNFYTLREIEQAGSLLENIEAFNTKRRLRGMEVE